MARVPEIQYRGVSAPRTLSPSAAAGVHRAKQSFVRDAFAAVGEVANAYTEDQINNQNADHRQRVLDSVQFIEENQTLTKQQLKDMDLYDQLETDLEVVPKHLWQTAYLQKNVEASRTAAAEGIQQPKARDKWVSTTQKADDNLLAASVRQSAQDAWKYHVNEMANRRKAAVEVGDWDRVEEIQSSQIYQDIYAKNPGMKELHTAEMAKGRELDEFNTLMVQGEYDEVMDRVSDVERPTNLTSDEQRRVYFAAKTQQDAVIAAQEEALGKAQDNTYVDMQSLLLTEEASLMDVVALPNNAVSLTQRNQLVTLARSLTRERAEPNSAESAAMENAILMDIKLARAGMIDESYADLDGFQREMRLRIVDSMTSWNEDGTVNPGLAPGRINFLMTQVEELDKVSFQSPAYKNMAKELSLRIMRSEDERFSFMASEDSALLMADALDSLHAYLEEEGPGANISQWEKDFAPHFYKKAVQMAYLGLDGDMKDYIVTTGAGERFGVDFQASDQKFQDARNALVTQGRTTQGIDSLIYQFNAFRKKYEGMNSGG